MTNFRFLRKHLAIPYIIYLICFVVSPVLLIAFYAFTDSDGNPSITNFVKFFTDGNTTGTLFYSILIAFATTVLCLLIAYPVAYFTAKSNIKCKYAFIMVFVLPMWVNFTLRITALKEILTVIEHNLAFYPFINTIIGMTYDFLPFMILPIYTVLHNIDNNYLEAALDLGSTPAHAFFKVTLPMSMPGIISGITMVFLPAMTNYVILDMLYNSTYIMGSLIGSYFYAYDWHNGSMISLILLAIILVVTLITGKYSDDKSEHKGAIV